MKDRNVSAKLPNLLVEKLDVVSNKRFGGNRSALIQTALNLYLDDLEKSNGDQVKALEQKVKELAFQFDQHQKANALTDEKVKVLEDAMLKIRDNLKAQKIKN